MAVKRYSGADFTDVTTRKRFDGASWTDLTVGKRYDGANWVDLWSGDSSGGAGTATTYVKTYSISSSANYWGSGNKDDQYPGLLIQGSHGNTLATTRRALMIFNYTQIAKDLSGAEIVSVRLRLQRTNTAHGTAGAASIYVKTHANSSLPTTWSGADSGNADSGTPAISRGETKWITLNKSVAEKLCSGAIKGLALDADSNYTTAAYIKFNKSATLLEITYKK